MTAGRAIWEVARRELVERSRSRVVRISFAVLLALCVGGAVAAARIGGGKPADDVGLVGARSATARAAIVLQAGAAGRRVRLHRLAAAPAAARALRAGQIDVALVDGRRVLVKRSPSAPAVRVVQSAVAAQRVYDALRAAGLSRAGAIAALAPRPLPVDVVEPGARASRRNQDMVHVGLFVLYLALVAFGTTVASSVTEEKSSRVVELLLTTVPPRRLLAGKVLGIGGLGLAELVTAGAGALVAGRLAGGAGLPSSAPGTVALVVLWFVLGYAFYSVAFAAVGALVSRQEDLSVGSTAVTGVMIVAFFVALGAIDEPNGTLAQVAAFVPFSAPMVVPARVVLGDMGALGLTAAVAVDLLATAGLIALAARVYERAILRVGAPVKLRGVLVPGRARIPRSLLEGLAVLALLAGVVVGLSRPLGIALMAVGLLLTAAGRHGPRRLRH